MRIPVLVLIWVACVSGIVFAQAGINRFDANQNCVLESAEFFALVDAWNGGDVHQSVLFKALDLWIDQSPIPQCDPDDESLTSNSCAIEGSLHARYPGDVAHTPVIIGNTEVDLFLTGANFIPAGTNISISISTGTQELVVIGGGFVGLFQGIRLTTTNRNSAFGSAVSIRDGTLSSNLEFASFRLQAIPAAVTTFTYVSVNATINMPGCESVRVNTSFQVGIPAASTQDAHRVELLGLPMGPVIQSTSREQIWVELLDMAGRRHYVSEIGEQISMSRPMGRLARGSYVLLIHSLDSNIQVERRIYSVQ